MRILVDLASHFDLDPEITQAERTPPMGEEGRTALNGKYAIPLIPDARVEIDTTSYVLNPLGEIDGRDVASQGMAWLLATYPSFEHIYFNPLLTADHVAELDFTSTWIHDGNAFLPRAQTGREAGGPLPFGACPNMTAILPQNSTMTPARPGVLQTDLIDIGPYTLDENSNPVGTDEFLVYWKLYGFEVSHDVAADYGALAGQNAPAYKYIEEVDQEPADFTVYLSIDDGTHWCPAGLLEPLGFCDKTTEIRLAFVNESDTKVYLATFAVLF